MFVCKNNHVVEFLSFRFGGAAISLPSFSAVCISELFESGLTHKHTLTCAHTNSQAGKTLCHCLLYSTAHQLPCCKQSAASYLALCHKYTP